MAETIFMLALLSGVATVSSNLMGLSSLIAGDAGHQSGWNGRWFPEAHRADVSSAHSSSRPPYLSSHSNEMWAMGNTNCDNGKQNLTIDVPMDESHFICLSSARYFEPNDELPALLTKYPIPPAFVPTHRCMNETISYSFPVPTFGPHRPVWAKWGEYTYLPPQRWIHNLEHGGVAMLYDPCAQQSLVNRVKNIVRRCLKKYIVTPYKLTSDRPIALAAWGWSFEMSTVNQDDIVNFIRQRANQGPESIDADGHFDEGLVESALEYSKTEQASCPEALRR